MYCCPASLYIFHFAIFIQLLEQSPEPAYREAVSRVFIHDPYAQIVGLSLASSNDLLLSTIRRSTVCGLQFLRSLTDRNVLNLYRLKIAAVKNNDAVDDDEGQTTTTQGTRSRPLLLLEK